jgi:nicotinamide riboside kinase
MSEGRRSIVPTIAEIDREVEHHTDRIAFHRDQVAILKAHRKTTEKLAEKGYQSPATQPEPRIDEPATEEEQS